MHIFSFEFKPFLQFLLSLSCSLILTVAVSHLILTSELSGHFSLATFEITMCSEIVVKVFFKTWVLCRLCGNWTEFSISIAVNVNPDSNHQ